MSDPKTKTKSKKRQKKTPAHQVGPSALTGSAKAKRLAAGILDILAGLRTTGDGAAALGISVPRYYALETRVIQAIINACEPQPRGRRHTPQDRIDKLENENARLGREISRLQAIVRAAQRSIGLPSNAQTQARAKPKTGNGKAKRKQKRKQKPRALKMIAALRKPAATDKNETADFKSTGVAGHTGAKPPLS